MADEPSLRDLVLASPRLNAEAGLVEQTITWQSELRAVRAAFTRDAHALASPRLWPDTLASLFSTGWRVAKTAAPDAPLALLGAAATSAGLPIAPPSTEKGAIERAQRLVRASGPAYIKLGQFIASSQGLLPDEWVEAFAWCRDDAPPLRPGKAEEIIERELGEAVLSDIDPVPLAAGSIGQVHVAHLADGRKVAVKVRRPGLRRRFRSDIETLALVVATADRFVPKLQAANLRGFVELFAELSLQELDFRLEALNAAESAAILDAAGIDAVHVPVPYAGLVTERVLVMPFVEGVRYDQAAARFGSELDGPGLLHTAIHTVLESTLLYGVFHGDLHAGNVLVPRPDRFNLLDFGICARLDRTQKASLVRYLGAFATGDAAGQVNALAEFGAFGSGVDTATLRRQLQAELDALDRRDGGAVTYDKLGVTLGKLLRVFAANGFSMPKELVLFFKNLLYLGSFASTISPDTDLFEAVTVVLGGIVEAHPAYFEQLAGTAG